MSKKRLKPTATPTTAPTTSAALSTGNHKPTICFEPTYSSSFLECIEGYKQRYGLPSLNLQEYTLIFSHSKLYQDSPRHALVVKKAPGTRHSGLFNLPGGKVESGELPAVCALRELYEETGCVGTCPQLVGAIVNGGMDRYDHPFIVYIYRVVLAPFSQVSFPAEQPASWQLIEQANSYKFVPNLALILPLVAAGIIGFVIQDENWQTPHNQHISKTTVSILPHDPADAAGTKTKKRRHRTV